MAYHRLCESDYRFLLLIWEYEPINSTELTHLAAKELKWKKSTVYTMVTKLSQKGLLVSENAIVRSVVSKERIQTLEACNFVNQVFRGSLQCFLRAFFCGKNISCEEAEELHSIIHQFSSQHDAFTGRKTNEYSNCHYW